MVLLRQSDIDTLAPEIGKIVIRFAEFESEVHYLGFQVQEALSRQGVQLERRKQPSNLKDGIEQIIEDLRQLGVDNIVEDLSKYKEYILTTSNDRHHIVHGQWWLDYQEDIINTRKIDRKTNLPEFRQWDVVRMRKLIETIKDMESKICGIQRQLKIYLKEKGASE